MRSCSRLPGRFATATGLSSISRQLGAVLGGAPIAIVGTPRPDRLTDAFDSGTMIASVPGARRARERADLVIRPRGRGVGLLELHLIDMMVEAGREAAMEALEQAPAELWS